jgi:hypothetical protein
MLCIINNIECQLSELQQTQSLKKSTVAYWVERSLSRMAKFNQEWTVSLSS